MSDINEDLLDAIDEVTEIMMDACIDTHNLIVFTTLTSWRAFIFPVMVATEKPEE